MLAWPRRTRGSAAPPPVALGADSHDEARNPVPSERSADSHAAPRELGRVGLFWSGTGVSTPTGAFRASGSQVATAVWSRALARFGHMENLDIFAPLVTTDYCRQQFREITGARSGPQLSVANIQPESEIPPCFERQEYAILHEPGAHDLTRLSYIRSRFAHRVFPITCSQHGISYSFELHAIFIRLLTAQVYPCDAIVCLTESSREAMRRKLEQISERYGDAWGSLPPRLPRLELIPWGVDTDLFAPRAQASARRDLDLPLERTILLCVGRVRIEDKMDLTPLLLAFERVCQESTEPPLLVLAGPVFSEYGEQIVAQAAQLGLRDNLRTFFNLPQACLPSLYAACDIFVSPSDSPSESFGLTIVEAMASGRPVVASDWNGYKELIAHGETGFKVRTDWVDCLGELNNMAPFLAWDQQHLHVGQSVSVDVAEMARYLSLLVRSRELRVEMGCRGRRRVEALYDWRVVIPRWEALWNELGAIADTLAPEERDRLDYLQPEYFDHFSHYASRIVDDATPVQLTGQGKAVLSGRRPLLLHPWSQGLLHARYLHAALAVLKSVGWMGPGFAIGEWVKILMRTQGLERDRALMHVMWLAKYDLITLGVTHEEGCHRDIEV